MTTVTDNDLKEVKELISQLAEKMFDRFDQVNEKINDRFDQVNEKMNNQFDQVNEKMNDRFDQVYEKMNDQFEQVNEKMNDRFEQVNANINELRISQATVETRLEDWKPSIDKTADLSEKIGELKNWRLIGIVLITGFITSIFLIFRNKI